MIAAPFLRLAALHVFSSRLLDVGLLYRATPLRADALMLGGALALAMRGPERQRVQSLGWPLVAAVLAIFAVFETVTFLHTGQPVNVALFQRNSVFGFTAIALLAAGLVLLAITDNSPVYRLCEHRWLRAIGQRSYGFYVYHLLFFAVWQRLAVALMLGHRRFTLEGTACVALVGTLVLSWASFRWIEAPMLRLKARLAV